MGFSPSLYFTRRVIKNRVNESLHVQLNIDRRRESEKMVFEADSHCENESVLIDWRKSMGCTTRGPL